MKTSKILAVLMLAGMFLASCQKETPTQTFFHGGSLTIWSNTPKYGNITVWIDVPNSNPVGTITMFYYSPAPTCGSYGCVNLTNITAGVHTYYAESADGHVWSGRTYPTVYVVEGQCNMLLLGTPIELK